MERELWQEILLPSGNEEQLWELFHENSKNGRYTQAISEDEVRARISQLEESLDFTGYPIIDLPVELPLLKVALTEAIAKRASARNLIPSALSLKNVATLLHYAYGITRDQSKPRPYRAVPSAGALYPLEIFFHSSRVDGLRPGLYHYNPVKKNLRLLQEGDQTNLIAQSMIQPDITPRASLVIFITAIFDRSVFKYGDRGYRYILLEAGHVAQNMNLVATAIGLGSLNIGGFFDREIDDFLGLDGVTHSTIYMIAIGKKEEKPHPVMDP